MTTGLVVLKVAIRTDRQVIGLLQCAASFDEVGRVLDIEIMIR